MAPRDPRLLLFNILVWSPPTLNRANLQDQQDTADMTARDF